MENEKCVECERLWRTYARVTSEHITLVNEQRAAYLNHDFKRASELDAEITRIGLERQAAGDSIYQHEAEQHQRFASRGSSTPARSAGGS